MPLEIGKVNVQDLAENDYKVLGIGINTSSNNNGIFSPNFTTLTQVKNNLINLILTKKGERVMQPEFGCDIWKVLFEPIVDGEINTKIEESIEEAVSNWMPFVNIDNVLFEFDNVDIDNHLIKLQLLFSLKSNPNIRDNVTLKVNA